MFRGSTDYIDSYYAATSRDRQRRRPSLPGPIDADVCVVGAGFFGLYCALEMARAGRQVVVLEASRVGWGASGRNGGQLVSGFACGMQRLKAVMGHERAKDMFHESLRSVRKIRDLIRDNAIDCDLAEGHVEVAVLPRRVKLLTDGIEEALREWGYDGFRFIPKAELPRYVDSPRFEAGLLDDSAAHIHPLKYILGLAEVVERAGATIYESTRVAGYEQGADGITVRTEDGAAVRCHQLVLAANAYVDKVDRRLQSRVLPVGSFIGVTEVLGEAACRRLMPHNHAVYDNQFILEYFRTTRDHRLLFGGGCTYMGGTPADLPAVMKGHITRVFPHLKTVKVDYAWGGHIDITLRRMPDWGRRGDRIFWAQGFCGHGIVPTRVAATVVTEAMKGQPERLDAFNGIVNPPFAGGEWLGGLQQAIGMSWYRLRDVV